MNELKDKILSAMVKNNLTQAQIAGAIGVTQKAVSDWLKGAKPRATKLKKLNDYLDSLDAGNVKKTDLPDLKEPDFETPTSPETVTIPRQALQNLQKENARLKEEYAQLKTGKKPEVIGKEIKRIGTHPILFDVVKYSLLDAREFAKKSPGVFNYHAMVTMVFSSLAFEAMMNLFGETYFGKWNDFESASPIAKLRIIANKVGVEINFDKFPWNEVRRMVKFRNEIAHTKPDFSEKDIFEYREPSPDDFVIPLKSEATIENAEKAEKILGEIYNIFLKKIPDHHRFGLDRDRVGISYDIHKIYTELKKAGIVEKGPTKMSDAAKLAFGRKRAKDAPSGFTEIAEVKEIVKANEGRTDGKEAQADPQKKSTSHRERQ
jgi:transcriptional regulator with XRE-family HTH domain